MKKRTLSLFVAGFVMLSSINVLAADEAAPLPSNPELIEAEAETDTTDAVITEVPVPEEPTLEEPTPEEPALEEPTPEEPTLEEPTSEEPALEEPTPEEPALEETTPEEPALEETTPEEPIPEEPTPENPEPDTRFGSWRYTGGRWWFQFEDGGYAQNEIADINGVTYAFDIYGWMITGWGQVDGEWYYCNGSGALQTGWIYINGTWYFLDKEYGFMYRNGAYEIDGQVYVFYNNGAMVTGWYQDPDGKWYYFDANGHMCYGWKKVGSATYYLDKETGIMYADGFYPINETDYYFLSSGALADGWVYEYNSEAKEGFYSYYEGGLPYDGWVLYGGKWYYIDCGWMVSDTPFDTGDGIYGFDKNGVMITGWYWYESEWIEDPSFWYYFLPSGIAADGWMLLNGEWYLFDEGWMADDGVYYIDANGEFNYEDGITYSFNTDGTLMRNTWHYDDWYEEWYYLDADGSGHNGWLPYGGKWYYCENGMMIHDGWYQTGKNEYSEFDENGVWLGSDSKIPE